MKTALIIGCNGQDGRLLYESLMTKGYQVTGVIRPTSHLTEGGWQQPLDIGDRQAVFDLLKRVSADEIYYLAAYHHSAENIPLQGDMDLFNRSFQVHVQSLIHFLEGMRLFARKARLFYAASSHVFGNAFVSPQDEQTPLNPKCIYGITKTAGIHACRFYRNQHQLFVSTGILYNHESRYRKPIFVTRKIILGAINIKKGLQNTLILGDLSAEIDWGYAPDFVEAFQKVLQVAVPDDFVIATGRKHSVQEFVEIVFRYMELDWKLYVREDKTIIAKKKGVSLVGDHGKITRVTGWKPSVNLEQMILLLLTEEGVPINMDRTDKKTI